MLLQYLTVDSAMAASQNVFCFYKLPIHKKINISRFVFEFSLCQHYRCCLLLLAKINIGMFFPLSPSAAALANLFLHSLGEAETCIICTEGHCMRNCVQCMHVIAYMQLKRAGGKRLFCSGRPKCVCVYSKSE
jgi:hypothetical protein